jgi:LmbE family N-acetylglucosaminyl deacetylase
MGLGYESYGQVVAISPHLDDAVLSAGAFLAMTRDPLVITVFAGYPPPGTGLTAWDADCGFAAGADVVGERRAEDQRAVGKIGGSARWLDFPDEQYRDAPAEVSDIAAELLRQLEAADPQTVAFPLGLAHPDHRQTFEACALLIDSRPDLARSWLVWADVPYRARHRDLVTARLEALRGRGFRLDPLVVESGATKVAALGEYPTQLKGLGDSIADAALPEQLFVLTSGA